MRGRGDKGSHEIILMPQHTFELLDGNALKAGNTTQKLVVYLGEVKQFNPTTFAFQARRKQGEFCFFFQCFQNDTQSSELFSNTLSIDLNSVANLVPFLQKNSTIDPQELLQEELPPPPAMRAAHGIYTPGRVDWWTT